MGRILVTGSSGHLGEALVRTLVAQGREVVGFDSRPSPWTAVVGSVTDRRATRDAIEGADAVLHTAALHKPQVGGLPRQAFVDTNISGTLTLLDAAADAGVGAFVMTSSTSVFGDALIPAQGTPAAWIDETVAAVPKNIYGATKAAAEDLCQIAHRNQDLPVVVLRASRFFGELDDAPGTHDGRCDDNVKADEYAYRRVALDDVVDAHLLAMDRAADVGFARYVVSATTPFVPDDVADLRTDARAVFERRAPRAAAVWRDRRWRFAERVDRVYDNARARRDLGWTPRFDVDAIAARVERTGSVLTPMAELVGSKEYPGSAYHLGRFGDTGG
ncbi:NAD-dependent epimerase/dehydratase family protein [Mycolicibacterium litorale]|uniref:NAD-dependent epimerase/dehydratase family protein n=1 Tax=Mycolicibacterium litorale TaxID=758802 RepID=UPI003CEEDED7